MMYSIFPKDESNIFVNIDDIFHEHSNINFKFILYCIHETSMYPYVSFLLSKNEKILRFLESKMSSKSELESTKKTIQETISPFELVDTNIKCFIDIEKKQAYIILEYKPLSTIIDFESMSSMIQALSYEIVNFKRVYDFHIDDYCYDFFLRHNYILYVKDHSNTLRFPIPLPVYKGTKRKYINDVILFGEMRMLNKAEYTYTDYEQALNESYKLHVLNMDYICLVLNDVKIMTKKNVGQCEVKGEYILCQGKKIAKLSSSKQYMSDGSNVVVLHKDEKLNKIRLKVDKGNYIEGGHVLPFYDNVIDDKNRIICKYITFSNDLLQHGEKEEPEKYMSYFGINQHESNINTNKSFIIKNKNHNFFLSTPDISDVSFVEFMTIP